MTDYCTVADVKALAGAQGADDDALIADLITRASAMVDSYTRRVFAAVTATRYFTPGEDTKGQLLYLDAELLSVTALTDGESAVPSDGYTLYPLNASPTNRIQLKSAYSWQYTDDPAGSVAVSGTWGYSATPPADIVQGAARLALWLYRQREAPFSKMGNTITGEYDVPVAFPEDVKALLDRYKRFVWGAV